MTQQLPIQVPNGKKQFCDANGIPLAGGSVTYYIPGTDTLVETWQDSAGTQPNANPIPLDAAGECVVWSEGPVREVVQDQFGNLVWDQVTGPPLLVTQLQNQNGSITYSRDVVFRFDNGGFPVSPGVLGDLQTTFGGTIVGWSILADQPGAIKLDIWKAQPSGASPPTSLNSIDSNATYPPLIPATNGFAFGGSLASGGANPLTGWYTLVTSGDWWRIDCVSCTTITRFTLTIVVQCQNQVAFQ